MFGCPLKRQWLARDNGKPIFRLMQCFSTVGNAEGLTGRGRRGECQ